MMKARGDGASSGWGQYFNMLMNKENQRVETEERDINQAMTRNISEEETDTALKGMKCGKAVGADEIPAEAWKCMGNFGIKILCVIVQLHYEYGTNAIGLATKCIDTNLQGKR